MTMVLTERTFDRQIDRGSSVRLTDLEICECTFQFCALSLTQSMMRRSIVTGVRLTNCVAINCTIGPAVVDDVLIDGLKTLDLLICWSPFLRHVVLRGKVGTIKVNAAPGVEASDETLEQFALARADFYAATDWALDITEAEFTELSIRGIPSRVVRRDTRDQVVVTRQKAADPSWRSRVRPGNTYWPYLLDLFLESDEDEVVLVAPRATRKKKYTELLDGLKNLRDIGVAEPD